jgi:AbrB family looped-hinge helix DNA binding protein
MQPIKKVKVTNHGMICIPSILREKYKLKDGDYVTFIEDEYGMRIIPIVPIEELRKESKITLEEMRTIIKQSHLEDLELDNK